MHFFLYEVVARLVAFYLSIYCFQSLRRGLIERKIGYYNSDFIGNLLIDWSNRIIERDTMPIRYWITIGLWVFALIGCVGVTIFGWWHPDAVPDQVRQ